MSEPNTVVDSPTPETQANQKAPVLKIPPNFEIEQLIEFQSGMPVLFKPKLTSKGKKENRWAYPSMIDGESNDTSETLLTGYVMVLGHDRIVNIIEDSLDEDSQYYWRLCDGDWEKFKEYMITGKSSREITDPARLIKESMKLFKQAQEAKKNKDMDKFNQLMAKSKELKARSVEILTSEEGYGDE